MAERFEAVTRLARELQQRLTLEEMLQILVDRTATLLATPRVNVRLFDATRTRLLAKCRAGTPLHTTGITEFKLGEGLLGWIVQNARPLRSGDADADARFAARPDLKEPLGSFVGVPLMSGETCIGVLSAVNAERDHFTAEDEELLTVLAALCAPHVELARVARLAQVDPLTGVLNRRGLDLAFPEVAVPAGADDGIVRPLSVAMADVDHFKDINDAHGHAAGDEVLRKVAALVSDVLRAGDAVVRYGGEEFLLILPGVEMVRAVGVAERARASAEASRLHADGAELRITLSIGVAERRPGERRDALIGRADLAMYAAKQAGRNRVARA
jgi:diguanylate cyclase (GGDEF)-like protein